MMNRQRCEFEVVQDGGLNNGAIMACPEPVERSMWFQGQHVRACMIHRKIIEEAEKQANEKIKKAQELCGCRCHFDASPCETINRGTLKICCARELLSIEAAKPGDIAEVTGLVH